MSATVSSVRPLLDRASRHGSAAGTGAGTPLPNAGAGSLPGKVVPSAAVASPGVLSAAVASAAVASPGVLSAAVGSAAVTSNAAVGSGAVPAAGDAAAHSGVSTGAGVS